MDEFFGTDGIRGTVGKPPITADFLLKVGWAVGSVLMENGPSSVIIGKDTRVSGYLFESALEAGFLSAGVNVGMLGPMPSPAIVCMRSSSEESPCPLRVRVWICVSTDTSPGVGTSLRIFNCT